MITVQKLLSYRTEFLWWILKTSQLKMANMKLQSSFSCMNENLLSFVLWWNGGDKELPILWLLPKEMKLILKSSPVFLKS